VRGKMKLIHRLFAFFLVIFVTGILALPQKAMSFTGAPGNVDPLAQCGLTKGPKDRVVFVVDGDTVLLSSGQEVRLVGIQAPKLPLGRKNFEPWPLSDEAKAHLETLSLHRSVQLYFGSAREDRHGRILAHLRVLEKDGEASLWVQGAMLEAGLARVYSFADNRLCVASMLSLERLARSSHKAIWSDPYYLVLKHYQAGSHLDTFQIVEGRVRDTAEVGGGVYLNFGENWREDFTVYVAKRDLRRFAGGAPELLALRGRTIRTRGWIKLRNGPMIDLNHSEQLEVFE
jgi:endonuclease YncB( thermonuclease family)